MDILVTTPKSEIDNSKKEAESCDEWFRVFKFKPKVNINEKIYFVQNGEIIGYGIIFEIQPTEDYEKCEETDREWWGDWVIRYHDWHWLKEKIKYKGFQGIRYVNRLPFKIGG